MRFLILLLVAAPVAAAPKLTEVAPDLAAAAGEGELVFLERRGGTPFRAFLAKRSDDSCAHHAASMVDVAAYPKLFPGVTKAKILKRGERFIDYELTINAPFDPVVPGRVEPLSKDTIAFVDEKTGGRGTFRLHDDGDGCLLVYHVSLPDGRQSGFVDIVRKVEPGGGDVGEMIGALASLRGYAPHGRRPKVDPRALDRLARRGIAISLLRKKDGGVQLKASRLVDEPIDVVRKRLTNRADWAKRADAIRSLHERGKTTRWNVGYLGGTVNLKTRRTDRRRGDGFEIVDQIIGGDVKKGLWRVHAAPAGEGATRLRVFIDADLSSGSFVLTKLAESNDTMRDALAIELALNMLVDVVDR
jgi:hypothetical protein